MLTDTTTDSATMTHAADRLLDAIATTGAPVCVGLDPVVERLPGPLRPPAGADGGLCAQALHVFGVAVLDAIEGVVPAIKPQSACYERHGAEGMVARDALVTEARERGFVVVLDAKRGDIGISAEHYAAASAHADWVTVNPYLGADGIEPFLAGGRGAFALVRTSNPGGDAIQAAALADGRTVADLVADEVARLGREHLGASGFSALGAVVGATKPDDLARLRARMPEQIFLIPGVGAQGGAIDDLGPCFDDRGRGGLVTASRSVIYAGADGGDWAASVRAAAERLAEDVGRVAGLR